MKNRQDARTIGRLAQRAFGVGARVAQARELGGGIFNAVYALSLADGREAVLKVAPDKTAPVLTLERRAMRTEVRAIDLIKAQTAVPVPAVYYYDDTLEAVEFEYVFLEKLEGRDFGSLEAELAPEQIADIERELGGYAAALHALRGESFGYFLAEAGRRATWADAFAMLTDDVLRDGRDRGVELSAPYGEIGRAFAAGAALLQKVAEPRFVHWDLWRSNVLVKDGTVAGIIDMERALWGDAGMESYFSGVYGLRHFCEGYGGDPTAGEKGRLRRALYDLHFYTMAAVSEAYKGGGADGRFVADKVLSSLAALREGL